MDPVALKDAIPETLADALIKAAGLVDDLDRHRREVAAAYGEGYVAGFQSGHEVGVGAVLAQIHEGSLVNGMKHGPLTPPLAELVKRRREVGEACKAFMERHGGEYKGGPVDFYTGRPKRDQQVPRSLDTSGSWGAA